MNETLIGNIYCSLFFLWIATLIYKTQFIWIVTPVQVLFSFFPYFQLIMPSSEMTDAATGMYAELLQRCQCIFK